MSPLLDSCLRYLPIGDPDQLKEIAGTNSQVGEQTRFKRKQRKIAER